MDDATGLAEALLGLNGFRVLAVEETPSEVVVMVETTADFVGCATCGVRAEAKDRVRVDIRDLPCFGRPARLVWLKRRWRCIDPGCAAKTWTEGTEHVAPRAVLTLRAGAEATRQVGELALPVAVVARELGVCWWTVMDAVVLHGAPLIEDPGRVKKVRALGIDETSFLSATPEHRSIYVTGLVDLDRKRIIDLVEGNAAVDLRRWWAETGPGLGEGHPCRRHGPGRELSLGHLPAPRPCDPCRRPVSCRENRQPLRRQGAPAGPERDARAPGKEG